MRSSAVRRQPFSWLGLGMTEKSAQESPDKHSDSGSSVFLLFCFGLGQPFLGHHEKGLVKAGEA